MSKGALGNHHTLLVTGNSIEIPQSVIRSTKSMAITHYIDWAFPGTGIFPQVTNIYSKTLTSTIEHARAIFCVKLSINNIVRVVHKNHIIRTCLMYHAACKVEFQPFKRSNSQLMFFNFLLK